MSAHSLLCRIPPAADRVFIRHVVLVGRRLPRHSARAYWQARRSHVRLALEDAGYPASEIAAHLESFHAAVREEAARQRAEAWRLEGKGPVEDDARQRGALAAGEASEAGP